MKMMEMSVNDSLDRSTWKAPDSSQHSENHRNDDTKLIEPSELHQLTSEVENTKLNNLLTTPLSKMSHSEMNELAQELSNRIDHVEGLQEKESSELFLENNKRNIGETKHRSFDQDAVPSVSNFLRNMRDMDNNARRSYSRISRLEDPLLKSENIEENDSLNPTDKSLQNRIRSNTSNNNSAEESVELKGKKNQITTSIAHWLQYFCCCHERWFLKRFVKYLRSWNTQILVFTLHIVGSILIVIHFLIMHFIGQQNKRNSISQPEHITPLLLVGGYASHGLLLSWCLIVLVIVAKSITRWNVRQMWAFYLLSAVLLGCVYRFYLTVDPDGISLPEGWGINHNQQFTYVRDFKNFSKWHNHDTFSPSPSSSSSSFKYSIAPVASEIQLSVLCIYFSITTQTSVGFGDIVPIAIPIRIISALHMFIGMVYGSMLVGLTMESDMSILIEYRHKQLTKQLKRLKRWRELQQSKYNYKMGFNDNGVHYGNSIYNTDGLSCCAKLWIQIKYIMMGCCYDYQGRCKRFLSNNIPNMLLTLFLF
jgi:FtsH-binding integral membrane protein